MAIEIKVPEVGESITEVQIGEWHCKEGDWVDRDKPLVSIETDKVTVEVTAPSAGRLSRIILAKGAVARVGDVVGVIESSAVPVTRDEPKAAVDQGPWASPSARRALAERGLRASDVSDATEPSPRRLLREDVERHAQAPAATSLEPDSSVGAVTGAGVAAEFEEQVVPMSPFRLRVAQRLLESQHQAALLTTFNEIDMSTVQQLRQTEKLHFEGKHGVKLGLMSFFVRAVVDALKAVPVVNAEVRGTDIVYKNHYDIGIAVGAERGLIVPVLRNVERLGFAAIERAIADFGVRAKTSRIELHELSGGTFTISNGGVFGSLLSTPIVNPPQSAILGLHAINDRPVARDGQVVIRPMMYVALTYDHRIIDGREAVTFLRRVKEFVEQPMRILLEL